MPRPNNRELGWQGEDRALEYLEQKGFTLVERNFQIKKGELDLICRLPDRTLVFVEVKTALRGSSLGDPETWLNGRKRHQLKKMAQHYLYARRLGDIPCRIDFVAVELGLHTAEIRHYENAVGF